MSIESVSLKQALVLWSELEAAFYGENRFGGDTAEIYLSSLQPRSALADASERGEAGNIGIEMATERHIESNRALAWFLRRFQEYHTNIKAILVEDVPLEKFDVYASRMHRLHVKIVKKKSRG